MKPISMPRELEQLAVRIHKLIEPTGAEVMWNERIPDPDTGSGRQIDGIIKRDGKIIHIECRDHESPQDVGWIEDLIGRRDSLRADGIIAVSMSGFREPAIVKARAKGIITRTLSEMTNAEIQSWGRTTELSTIYFEIAELAFWPIISYADKDHLTDRPRLRLSGSDMSPEFFILQQLTQDQEENLYFDRDTTLTGTLQLPALRVDEAPVLECGVRVKGRKRREREEVLGLWNYHGFEPGAATEAVVSRHGPGLTEIIQQNDKATMLLDLSRTNPPANCFLLTWQVDFGRTVTARFETVGGTHRVETTIDTLLDVKGVLPWAKQYLVS